MTTLFTRIIQGELPARFVWKDDQCVAFLSIQPLQPGHTLVVPIREVDHWLDADQPLLNHLMEVARKVGQAQQRAFTPEKVGLMVAGLEVPHLHVHVVPINGANDMDFSRAQNASGEQLDESAQALRRALQELGYSA